MKLVYANHVNVENPGTIIKIESQAEALKRIDPRCEIIAFYHGNEEKIRKHHDLITYVPLPFRPKLTLLYLSGFIYRHLRESGADVVILRSVDLTPMFWYHFRKRPYKLITEHHTKIIPELFALRRYVSAVSTILCRPLVNRMLDGKISVTPEIHAYEASGAPAVMVTNGALLSDAEVTSYAPFDGKALRMAMLCSKNWPWHGCPRIFRSIREWQSRGDLKITLDLIGDVSPGDFPGEAIPEGVIFHGLKGRSEMAALLKQANLGISTLALYTKKMDEACPRKSRDYIARGMPFIYGYRDPDIFETDSFAMRVPNDDSLIPLDRVLGFLRKINEDRQQVERELADAAENRISWATKMREYYDFASRVLGGDAASARAAGAPRALAQSGSPLP